MTRPPLAAVCLSKWSGTFRVELQIALAELWEKMTGAALMASVSTAVCRAVQLCGAVQCSWDLDRAVRQVDNHPQAVHLLDNGLKHSLLQLF